MKLGFIVVIFLTLILATFFVGRDASVIPEEKRQLLHAESPDSKTLLGDSVILSGQRVDANTTGDQAIPPASNSELSQGAHNDSEFSSRLDLAKASPEAFQDFEILAALCEVLKRKSSDETERRLIETSWSVVKDACPADIKLQSQNLSNSLPDSFKHQLDAPFPLHRASTAEEFAQRDAFLEDIFRNTTSALQGFNAALSFFDYERFAQWAGPLTPQAIFDQRSFQHSRIGLDIAWIYACRLGLDCGPYAGLTLNECWQTPGCVPGGAARQVVQMRRSPLELRLVDSMVERLLAERTAVRR